MIRELEVALLLFGACVVLCCEWMLDGSGSKPRALCPLSRSWMAFVLKMIHYHAGLARFPWAACNCFSQHSCTEGKKSCWNRWTQPNLALASKIQNSRVWRNKTKKLIYVATIVSPFVTHKKCDKVVLVYVTLMCHGDRTPPRKHDGFSKCARPLLHPRAHQPFPQTASIDAIFQMQWQRTIAQVFHPGYKSCVCRQLRGPDGMRIIWFINGGLEPRLHGVKGACKQLNVGNSKVVFDTGTKDRTSWYERWLNKLITQPIRWCKHLALIVFGLFCYCLSVFAYLNYIPVNARWRIRHRLRSDEEHSLPISSLLSRFTRTNPLCTKVK